MSVLCDGGEEREAFGDLSAGARFCVGELIGCGGNLGDHGGGDGDYAVHVADDEISWGDGKPVAERAANLDGLLEAGDLPASDALRRCAVACEDGQAAVAEEAEVADAAIYDCGDYAAAAHGGGEQIAEAADALGIVTRPEGDYSRSHAVDGFELHAVVAGVGLGFAGDGKRGPSEEGIFAHGEEAIVEHRRLQVELVEDVCNGGGAGGLENEDALIVLHRVNDNGGRTRRR